MDPNNNNYNEIDLSCRFVDDDDDSFGKLTFKSTPADDDFVEPENRAPVKTGITIDLSDDDSPKRIKTIKADTSPEGIRITKNFQSDSIEEYSDPNEIDMETDYSEDDDLDDYSYSKNRKPKRTYNFADNEYDDDSDDKYSIPSRSYLEEYEDMDEGLTFSENRSKQSTYDEIEDDYWDKLKKKYEKKNKNGRSPHEHFGGDPKKEMDIFNHEMFPQKFGTEGLFDSQPATGGMFTSDGGSKLMGTSNATTISNAAVGAGTSESLKESTEDKNESSKVLTKKLKDLLNLIGFEVLPNSDGSVAAIDLLDEQNPEIIGKSLVDLFDKLKPYIDDCIIQPLQIKTGKKFDKYAEWVNWYHDKENQVKYPRCKTDIDYCDILCNHLNECFI